VDTAIADVYVLPSIGTSASAEVLLDVFFEKLEFFLFM
jgi:hypothetical protein